MSYDRDSLFRRILLHIRREPCTSLQSLSKELRVSRRTIQEVIRRGARKSYRALRRDTLVAKSLELFSGKPSLAIKEVSFAVGFASPRSFARAIKKATGMSPEDLRSRVLENGPSLVLKSVTLAENTVWIFPEYLKQ
ncbi:MAG: helix-turn-helix domain-containing protein [Candidatus Acidiferrum sp.]